MELYIKNKQNSNEKIEWTPLVPQGATIKTYQLVKVSDERLEFRITPKTNGIFITVLLAGLFTFLIYLLVRLNNPVSFSVSDILIFVFSLALLSGAFLAYFSYSTPRVFDKNSGYYFKGKKISGNTIDEDNKHVIRLEDIYALQILSEKFVVRQRSYTSYELNIVLNDFRRINVVDHSDIEAIRKDATAIAEFLGVQVMERIEN
jgi:hypothetical protein